MTLSALGITDMRRAVTLQLLDKMAALTDICCQFVRKACFLVHGAHRTVFIYPHLTFLFSPPLPLLLRKLTVK